MIIFIQRPSLDISPFSVSSGDVNFFVDIELDFKTELRFLVPHLLSPKHVVVKEINGQEVTCQELVEYFKVWMLFVMFIP